MTQRAYTHNSSSRATVSPAGETARRLSGALLFLACAAALSLGAPSAAAQAVLTVTPGATAGTVAGTGSIGYSGDNGPAASATFASPSAVAYDAAGNLYIADSNNNVVRMVTPSGTVTTVAGTGQQGFAGDGGPATSAWLDTPTGIAVDTNGNLYIADSHNNRIREVSGGVINTVAGNGTAGFSGDNGAAANASLDQPTAVAVDSSGNLYIADTDNERIREVSGGTITTIVGDGVQGFSGDGGSAASASLDGPTGIAIDGSGDVFIADRHNQRIREVSGGVITTVAGGAATGFSGGFSGDGGSPTAAALARPSGVAIDAAGNLYISDTDNQRLREVGNGSIATIAGSGTQGYGGDSGLATAALLNQPRTAAVTPSGNIAVADQANQRVRSVNLPSIAFPAQAVGVAGTAQAITLTNSGSGTLTVQSIAFTGSFQLASGGTCSAVPISLSSGSSCTQNIEFLPTAAGSSAGSVILGGSGVVPQTVLLSGSATQSAAIPVLASSLNPSVYGNSVTFTATMPAGSTPAPTGTIAFYDGTTSLASATLSGGAASFSTSSLTAGPHSITAAYSGDAAWLPETSTALPQVVQQATPTIQWTAPAAITYGTALSATQLDATASVPGTLTYSPALGAVLNAGSTTLSVTFTPNDTTDYTTATENVGLTVNPASTSLTMQATPPKPVYGTLVQFSGAIAPVPSGVAASAFSFVIDQNTPSSAIVPAATYANGTVSTTYGQLHAGTHSVVLSFAGTSNYTSASSAPVSVQVQQATPTITWATPAAIVYGTPLTAAQLNASASVSGTLTYSPALGAVLTGGQQTLSVSLAPTDSTDYTTASQSVVLTVNPATPAISLTTSAAIVLLDNPTTFTASVTSSISTPTGMVSFYDGTTLLGTSPLTAGVAALTTSSLSAGTHSITAAYSGDTNFTALTSSPVTQNVEDFTLSLTTASITSATVTPGGTAVFNLVVSPLDGASFPAAVTLSASGLPSGAVATFSPSVIPAGSGSTSVTLTITVPNNAAALHHEDRNPSPAWFAMIFLPFAWRMRRAARRLNRALAVLALIVAAAGAIAGLTGCGSGTGYFGHQSQTYNISVTATSGALSHSAAVTLTVE